jgi:choline dehydrogenase-like flavoprotein
LALAHGLGGGTQVYTGTSLLPEERVIDGWNLPGLRHSDLVLRGKRLMAQNGVHLLPSTELNDNNRLFQQGCEALGWPVRQFPVNVRGCKGSSLCNLGCPNGAKQGTRQVQIPQAVQAGVEVVTRATAQRVQPDGDGGGIVDLLVDDAPHPHGPAMQSAWPAGPYQIHARTVVVCAGAVHSPALLLRSGLGDVLPALGRYWTCQPAHILVGEHPAPITNTVGHPKSFVYDDKIVPERYFLEACMYFPFVTAKNLGGFGPEHHHWLAAYNRLQMILVLAVDDALPDHRVTINRAGDPVIHYTLTDATRQALVAGTRAAARIFFAAGAQQVHAPSARPALLQPQDLPRLEQRVSIDHLLPGSVSVSAAHLMGGCKMGVSERSSVTTPNGQVHGQPWLYVADASLFPTAAEINPYVTIMALAEHVGDHVARRLGGVGVHPPAIA